MADLTPDPAPETPEQPHARDGWELLCTGVLRSDFGKRPTRALDKAMMQLSAEQAWVEGRAEVGLNWWRRLQEAFFALPISRVAAGLAVMAIIAAVVWVVYPGPKQPTVIQLTTAGCRIADSLNARWSKATGQLKQGDILPVGQLRLESGVVELTFASGARAAIEGPTELTIIDRNSMELRSGRMSAEVPKNAIGFTVKAPKPRSSTRSPRDNAPVIWSKIVATISSTSAPRRCGLLTASSAMSSDLVMIRTAA